MKAQIVMAAAYKATYEIDDYRRSLLWTFFNDIGDLRYHELATTERRVTVTRDAHWAIEAGCTEGPEEEWQR
jgi:hypothetical protein